MARRARRIVGGVAVDQHVDVGVDVGEHAPHHVALALVRLAAHDGAGRARDLDGAVGRIVVVDVDRRRPAARRGNRPRPCRWRLPRCSRAPAPRSGCRPTISAAAVARSRSVGNMGPLPPAASIERELSHSRPAHLPLTIAFLSSRVPSARNPETALGRRHPLQSGRRHHRPPGRARRRPTWSGSTPTILSRTGSRGDDDPGGRQPPDLVRRQAAAADADAGDGEPHRLFRRRPHQARRRGRVHAHRDAAARRRGRRERDAARQARRAHALGQRGERAGRRLPARPGVQDDGRGRLAARARNPVQRRRRDRRGRGDAARRRQEHRDHRGRISRGDPRQDRRTVRRRLRGRPGARPTGRRPSRPPAARSA